MCDSRREFLRAGVGAVSGLALAGAGAARGSQAALRMRKDVSQLTATSPDLMALTTAVGRMKAGLGAGDRRNWVAQAQIHGSFTGGFTHCQHGNWFFLPWHRGYLYFFEEIVRELSGFDGFALPYWDWSKDFALPSQFWGAGNPLDDPPRAGQPDSGRGINSSSTISARDQARFVNRSVVAAILNQPDFETFAGIQGAPGTMPGAGELEQTPHNFIHRWVNNDMATAESPFDPIFWLHHCNVDRLWTEWVKKHPSGMPMADPSWTGTRFSDFCDRNGNPTNIAVGDTLTTTNLGYDYAPPAATASPGPSPSSAPAPAAVPPGAPIPPTKRDLQGRQGQGSGLRSVGLAPPGVPAEFVNGVAVYRFVPPPDQAERFSQVAEHGVEQRNQIVRMRLQGVKIPRNQNVALQVYVNCELLKPGIPITDPSYIRSSTFFYPHGAGGHGGEEGHGTISFVMNVKPALGRLYADRRFTRDEPLKVVVTAEPLFPGAEDAWRGEIQEVSPEQVSFEIVEARGPA